jgi:ParB-like chromosome segregation protein Spo0J
LAKKITWQLKTYKLADLTDYYKNPRSLSEKEFKQLKTSLDKFGMIDKPIVNLDAGNTIIGGHQRKHVLEASGVSECECWVPDRALTEREVEELNIRLNKNTGAWDFDVLANEFELPDLIEWGFEPFELGVNDEPAPDFKEYDESVADEVEFIECPNCGHKWPK